MWNNVTVLEEHTSGTPLYTPSSWYTLENSGTPWGVSYTRLTSTGLEESRLSHRLEMLFNLRGNKVKTM